MRIDDDDIELHNLDTIDLTGLYSDGLAEPARSAARPDQPRALLPFIVGPSGPSRSTGLWRSPVAHLVRIEGVRGSNPLSSTYVPMF